VQPRPGPPFHSDSRAGSSIADRRNDTAEKAEHNRPGTPIRDLLSCSRSSAAQSGRLRIGGSQVQFLSGVPILQLKPHKSMKPNMH
jgi:hypothetical protein